MRKKCLVTGYINLNLGDDLFFDILFRRFKQIDFYFFPPSVLLKKYKKMFGKYKNVIFYDENPEYKRIREDITDENISINLFPLICDCAKIVDFYIIIGGSIFIQNDNWKNDDRFIIKDIIKDKPSFIVGCNFGPGNKEYENYFKEWFKEFDDVCFRDNFSYNKFKDLKNVRRADDIVLCRKKEFCFHQTKSLGISVIDLSIRKKLKKYEEIYIDWHANIIREYLDKGFKVTLYSFCKEEGDLNAIQKILKKLPCEYSNKIKICDYQGDLSNFIKSFKKNKYIIGSRLHSIILSIVNKQLFVPISYSNKINNILKDFDKNIEILNIDSKLLKSSDLKFEYVKNKFDSKKQFSKINEVLKNTDLGGKNV